MADLDRDADRVASAVDELEQRDRRVRLPVRRAPRVEHVRQALDLDRAVDREIGPRATRQRAREIDVDLHGAALHGRIDPRHATVDDAVARVDVHQLIGQHVARLRLGHAQLGAQVVRRRDARDVRADHDALTLLDEHLLDDARDTGAHHQRLDAHALAFVRVARLLDARLADSELCLHRRGELIEPFLLDVALHLELPGEQLRALVLDLRHDIAQLLLRFGLEPLAFVLGLGARERGPLVELLVLERELELGELGVGLDDRVARFLGLLDELGVRHLDEHVIGGDDGAGAHDDALDAPFGLRADPADRARDECAGAANLAQHFALPDAVDPDRPARYRRRGRLEPHDAERRDADDEHADGREAGLAHALLALELGAWDVHERSLATAVPDPSPTPSR